MTRDEMLRHFRAGHEISVDLPARAASGNRYLRLHWAKRREENRKWDLLVLAYLGPGPFKNKNLVGRKVLVVVTAARRVPQDADNLALSLKPLMDALKKNGWLYDDSPKYLECYRYELTKNVALTSLALVLLP
jgi:hypothetical protein